MSDAPHDPSKKSGSHSSPGGFGDTRKPRATFGDVMKGIPAGRPHDEKPQGGSGGKPGDANRGGPRVRRGPGHRDAKGTEPGANPAGKATEHREGKSKRPADGKGHAAPGKGPTAPGKGPTAPGKGPEVTVIRKTSVPGVAGPAAPRPPPVAPPSLVYSRAVEEQGADDESFADLLAQQDKKSKGSRGGVRPGATVTGVIIQIGQDTAFLTLKEGGEAMIELRELQGEDLPEPRVGDTVEGFVVSVGGREGGVRVSKGLAKGAANVARLEVAHAGGIPVEGTVTGVNKGGLEVDLGGVRAFCPLSQADVRFVEKPEGFVGQKLTFKVTELRGTDVVLSRRALLQAEQAKEAERVRESLTVGAHVRGTVISLRDFGAFVDLGGGIEGMIHVSELSHGRVTHPGEVLQVGQEVQVEITKIEAASPDSPDKSKHRERIGLSLRALAADPWDEVAELFPVGARVTGKVVRIQPFGAFVNLAPGVDGLIHVSNFSDQRIGHPKDVVSDGQEVEVVVERVDLAAKKIGLALWREGYTGPREGAEYGDDIHEPGADPARTAPRPAARSKVGDVVEAQVDRVEPFGVFVSWANGRGLIPNVEMGTPRGTDHKKQFPPGTKLKALVQEIDNQGRLRLSKTGAELAEERAEVHAYLKERKGQQKGSGFGTLGDLLKAKLQK